MDGYSITTAGLATHEPAIKDLYGYELEDLDQDYRFDTFNENTQEEEDRSINNNVLGTADGDLREEDLNNNDEFDVPALYYKPRNRPAQNSESRFDIEIQQTSKGASSYNLGFSWVPGSETVTINNDALVRGTDYDIDEFTGTLTIFDIVMNKYADPVVTIEYEENELFSFDKKVMLGTRAELDLGENSFLGATGLYYNQSKVDDKVDVGNEPIRNMLWDINGRFARETPWLTRLVDRLPLIETDAVSDFRIEGEIAQVLPNPNPLGEAYIDDFEASKEITSPTMRYAAWWPASPPLSKSLNDRRKLAWWNPFTDRHVKSIWPTRETSAQAQNTTTTVLVLDAFFDRYEEVANDDNWGGIMYALMAGDHDQTQSKFFEIWLHGYHGEMHVDLGVISEDVDDDGLVDTEDIPIEFTNEGNGYLDAGEDVGLDGCSDAYEDGMGGCFGFDDDNDGTSDEELFNGLDDDGDGLIDEDLSVLPPLADLGDPNGDNWSNTQSDYENDFVNGTEGNHDSMEGSFPDSEDMDGQGVESKDVTNDYFTFSFNLDSNYVDPRLLAGETRYIEGSRKGELTGWRLFRIPLADFEVGEGMEPNWNDIKALRVWVDGLGSAPIYQSEKTARIEIAKIEIVGNEWQEVGIAPINSEEYILSDSLPGIAVTVANTEDNDDYTPPPGIKGEFDRINQIRLKEQSLVMDFTSAGIDTGYKSAINKIVDKQEGSFLIYGTMELFLHGYVEPNSMHLMTEDTSFVWFWMRLAQGEGANKQYYEVRKPVYTGWDRNTLRIDMAEIARLKIDPAPEYIMVDNDTIAKYTMTDGMEVYIKGDPSLERIKEYRAGVMNMHKSDRVYGRVMMDELRLADVNRDKGMAMRIGGSMKFADLLRVTLNYSRKDADFHTVQQQIVPGPKNSESFDAGVQFFPDQFLPQDWGVKLPLSVSFARSISSPKYFTGKDIPAGDIKYISDIISPDFITGKDVPATSAKHAPVDNQTRNHQISFKTSFNKSSRSRYWLMRQSLDRFQGSITLARRKSSSVQILANESQNIASHMSYPVTFSADNYFEPLRFMEKIPWLGERFKETRFYYSPTSVNFSADITEGVTSRKTRAAPETINETYNLNLKRVFRGKYRLTEKISADYSWNMSNAMDHLRHTKLDAVKEFDTGYPVQSGETFSANWDAEILRWLKPKLTYQGKYGWTKNTEISNDSTGARISTSGRMNSSVSISPKELVEIFYTPETKTTRGRRSRRNRSGTDQDEGTSKKLFEIKNEKARAVLKSIHAAAGQITPLSVTMGYGHTGAEPATIGTPPLAYKMGLSTESGLPFATHTTGLINLGENRDLSLRSGFNLGKSINVSFSQNRKWQSTERAAARSTTESVDYLVLTDGDVPGIPFVSWNIRFQNVEKLPLLNKVPWRVSMDHAYSGTKDSRQQNKQPATETYRRAFQPLARLTMSFNNGISSNLGVSNSMSLQRSEAGDSKTEAMQINGSIAYQHRGGLNIPLPFLRDFKMQNTANFSLDVNYSSNIQSDKKGAARKFEPRAVTSKWGIKPSITYSFTNKVSGSLIMEYNESFHNISGKRITRRFQFDVNIAIRGQ
ncbi:MAG: cell surface protein SprA [Candidatus Marinimicrobia bacterium]|nr:cell surface protein SprA [Candidatus Neomarinimicrobiota bacterium]